MDQSGPRALLSVPLLVDGGGQGSESHDEVCVQTKMRGTLGS